MPTTNANKRQRPAEAREAKRHLEEPAEDGTDPAIMTDEDLMGVREDDGGDEAEPEFQHPTDYDFQQIDDVEISDDGDDPDEDGDADADADADDDDDEDDADSDESRGSPASPAGVTGKYCGDGYSDAVEQCSDERRCDVPEDCSPLSAVMGYPLGCYPDIACTNDAEADEAVEIQQEAENIVDAEEPEPKEPTASPIAPPEPTASPSAQPEPTASPVIPAEPTAAPVVLAEPTAAPVVAADENAVVLEPTAAPIVPSTAAPAPVVGEDEGNAILSEPTTSPTVVVTVADAAPPVTTTDTTSTPEPTAAPTLSPTDPAPVLVTRETDEAGNAILYSCADAAPTLTDPATGATAPSYQSMVVEFDYELYWNEGSANNDASANEDEGTGPVELTDIAGDLASGGTIGKCQADCDSDDQCAGDLRCFQREAYEPVPGCAGAGSDGWDYCYDPQDEVEDSSASDAGTRNLQDGSNAVLAAAVNRIAGTYLANLAEQYDLAGKDCAAIESAFDGGAVDNGSPDRKTMLRRTLMRKLQGETTVVEISDGGDVIDDVDCVTDAPSNYPSASCVPVKAKVGVKYTGTDEASIRSAVFSTAKSQVESLPADVSGKFVGITFVGQRVDESAGKDNLNPFPGNLSPGVAAAQEQQTNEPEGYAPVGILLMAALSVAVLLVGLLVGRAIRNRTRRNKATNEMTGKASKSKIVEEGSFAGIASIGSDRRISIERRSIDESGQVVVSSPATSAPTEHSGEYDEVEVELNPDDLAEPSKMEKKRSRGLGIFRTRSRSKSPGTSRQRSRSKSPGANESGANARSILDDLNQEENMAPAPPINRTSTNQSIEACLDYYNYDDTMIDSRGRSVTPTRSLIDDDEDVYGIVDLGN